MDRRMFLERGLHTAAGLSVLSILPDAVRANEPAAPVTAGDINKHLLSLGKGWINPKNTVDTLKTGRPDVVVKGIATAWMGYTETIKKAKELDCNVMVVHEPIYYNHRDADLEDVFAFKTARDKREFANNSGVTIIRCHDVWDRVPKIGIRDSWASFLGLTDEIVQKDMIGITNRTPFAGVYKVPPIKAEDYARSVAKKLAPHGQDTVRLVGPTDKVIRTVAIGTGAVTRFKHMAGDLKADLCVCSNDGFRFWQDGSLAVDMGLPVVVVSHGLSEEFGMRALAKHLAARHPQIPVHHIAQKYMARFIRA
ncbi:MAG: Nif3-like dinuclear metal center hexameric protein [Pirellulales bacterium]|nr:Nif3-like dinuclear metal center hexameric protein [Pirellulales bacterium]